MKIVCVATNDPFPVIHLMEDRAAYLIAMTCSETENSQFHLFYGMDGYR